uniref:Uncharacterized protein n=1 Tax=Calidris pygmaea TaxID=425635 RepID=A0A8C3KK79_9CHAR
IHPTVHSSNPLGDRVESLAEVKVDNIHCPPSICLSSHAIGGCFTGIYGLIHVPYSLIFLLTSLFPAFERCFVINTGLFPLLKLDFSKFSITWNHNLKISLCQIL